MHSSTPPSYASIGLSVLSDTIQLARPHAPNPLCPCPCSRHLHNGFLRSNLISRLLPAASFWTLPRLLGSYWVLLALSLLCVCISGTTAFMSSYFTFR